MASSSSWRSETDDELPVYRSLAAAAAAEYGAEYDGYVSEDELVYRSVAGPRGPVTPGIDDCLVSHFCSLKTRSPTGEPARSRATPSPSADVEPFASVLDLPADVFQHVLLQMPCFPGLFNVMAVCTAWRDAARASQQQRQLVVPAAANALLRAVERAWPGDTLRLDAGVHALDKECLLDKPLRLVVGAGAAASSSSSPGSSSSPISSSRSSDTGAGGGVVITGEQHVLLRTRANVVLTGLTFCRMGQALGHPNAVVHAEAALLHMEGCRITCGGSARSVGHALRAFDGAPQPGHEWLADHPLSGGGDSMRSTDAPAEGGGGDAADPLAEASEGLEELSDAADPQSGVWVGSAARARLRGCTISCCLGPGIKICRGELDAEHNTIAFSRRGSNVVTNGGKVLLRHNAIHGANGDGISSWNHSQIQVVCNTIHSNAGAGIAINAGGGAVTITQNSVRDNTYAAVEWRTGVSSAAKQATLRDNEFSGNSFDGVHGLSPPPPLRAGALAAEPRVEDANGKASMEWA